MKKAEATLLEYANNNKDELSTQIKRYIEGYKQIVESASVELNKEHATRALEGQVSELERKILELEYDNQVKFENEKRWRTIAENLSAIVFSDDE